MRGEVLPFPISRSARWVATLAEHTSALDGEEADAFFRKTLQDLAARFQQDGVRKDAAEREVRAFSIAALDAMLRAHDIGPRGGAA